MQQATDDRLRELSANEWMTRHEEPVEKVRERTRSAVRGIGRRCRIGSPGELIDRPACLGRVRNDSGGVWPSLGVVVSSSASPASPSRTNASFHARLAASRTPEHRPCPRNGGIWCAASPARNTRPLRIALAMVAWNR